MPTAWIVWEFDYDSPEIKCYGFETAAEVDAFALGVIEADPSNEYHSFFRTEKEAERYLKEREED
jgi:hypothetical protein